MFQLSFFVMKNKYLAFISMIATLLLTWCCQAQVINPGLMDTTDVQKRGKVTVGGYVDAYYGFNVSQPADGNNPYFVSAHRHNEATINLAYVDLKYTSERVRARFVPGFGTYINANYAAEPGALKNIIEGNVGVKLSKTKEIWLDAGVLGSPYTNESAISKDHLMYTRSYAPEYVPYYVAGAKLSLPLSTKVTAYLYFLNGWQQIQDQNRGKSLGTQLEYRPTSKLLLNWNTYVGDERSAAALNNRTRYFTDVYAIYNPDGKFTFTTCMYYGIQMRDDMSGGQSEHAWWQANFIARYRFSDRVSLSGRIEHFSDPGSVQIAPVTPVAGFRTSSTGLCLNVHLTDNAMFRLEGRQFFARDEVYLGENQNPVNQSSWLISNLTVWF
jgi:Putative beta-barrel porin-2, OmpL-like. bbp2